MSNKPNQTNHSSPQEPQKKTDQSTQKHPRGGSHAKPRRVRYDRIAVVVVPLFLIVVIVIALCLRSCSKDDGNNQSNSSNTTTPIATAVTETTTTDSANLATDTSELSGDETEITLPADGVKKGNLIVINEDHIYTFPDGDPDLKSVYEERNSSYSVSDMEVQLDSETLDQLNSMMAAFEEETGYSNLQVFSGYRTAEDQDKRYDNGNTSFRGGYSDYHSGRSFNLRINFDSSSSDYYNTEKYPDYSWIAEHAAEYGFVVRYPDGKDTITGEESRTYTFRYVGVAHAIYMTEHDLCLEEYVETIQDYTADNPLEITVDDITYSVFYVPIGGTNDVSVTIPSSSYTVSGDNIGGYIITCQP